MPHSFDFEFLLQSQFALVQSTKLVDFVLVFSANL